MQRGDQSFSRELQNYEIIKPYLQTLLLHFDTFYFVPAADYEKKKQNAALY